MQFDYSLCGKWPELLKQMAPEVRRVGVLRDPAVTEDIGQFAVIQSVASRASLVSLAARHKLPTVYSNRAWPDIGGLISYGADFFEQYRNAAGYIDRILRGEKPADMPVQAPVKYELVINLKTAKALGLIVPQSILARADEVIE